MEMVSTCSLTEASVRSVAAERGRRGAPEASKPCGDDGADDGRLLRCCARAAAAWASARVAVIGWSWPRWWIPMPYACAASGRV